MLNKIKALIKSESGAETLEYVVIVAIIIAAAVGIYNTQVGALITTAFTNLTTAMGGGGG